MGKKVKVKNKAKDKTKNKKEKSFPEDKSKEVGSTVKICQKISRAAIYLLVFLTPLFFLPWTSNVLDFNKQFLAGILVFVALIAWLSQIVVSGKIKLKWSVIHLFPLLLILMVGASTIFSLWPSGSFWGHPLPISESFFSLLIFALAYFMISNLFEREDIHKLLFTLALSGLMAALLGGLQISGKFLLPFDFAQRFSFNSIGSVNGLAVFLAALLPLSLILALRGGRLKKIILGIAGVAMLAVILGVNFWGASVVLIIGSAALLIFGTINIKGTSKTGWVILPMILLVLAIVFSVLNVSLIEIPGATEVTLAPNAELNIAKQTLKLGKYPLWGTGPATFGYSFSQFKPESINQTVFWNARLNVGASEFLDRLITTGILGIVFWLATILAFIWLGIKISLKSKNLLTGGVLASFLGLVGAQFLYPANFSLLLLWWLMMGAMLSLTKPEIKFLRGFRSKKITKLNFEQGSPKMVGASFVLVIVLILSLTAILVGTQRYLAEVNFKQGIKAWDKGNMEQATLEVQEATRLNPKMDTYWRGLSQMYLVRLNQILQKDPSLQQANRSQIQNFITSAVNSAKKSTQLNPQNVDNWNVEGFVYRNMMGILGGAQDWAQKSYLRALELEPSSPYLYTELGKMYLAESSLASPKEKAKKQKALSQALDNFQKATELKADYAPANFQIALVYERQGKTSEAISKLKSMKQKNPLDVGLAFQLGILYWRQKDYSQAQTEFERAVSLDKDYSNARYFLGLTYDKRGKTQQAIEQFEKVLDLNPENQEAQKILSNLKAGKNALEGLGPAQPIEQKPQETPPEVSPEVEKTPQTEETPKEEEKEQG